MASPENVHFVLRPNKNIERKLIVDALGGLSPVFNIKTYRYVGMGSFWFVDFLLFHKVLSIQDMVSIEKETYGARADFNRPLRCIRIEAGDSTKVLPELQLRERESIIWLDYDSDLHGPVLEDCRIVSSEAKPGSVLLVTLNAYVGQIKNQKDEEDRELVPFDALKRLAPDLVPMTVKSEDLSLLRFPRVLAEILIAHIRHCARKANPEKHFIPIFNYSYKDGAPMVTVGGMIADADLETKLEECHLSERYTFVTGEKQFEINVPPLTMKEKFALDRLLPSVKDLTGEEVTKNLGFKLRDSQLQAYRNFYRHYPVFGEMQF